MTSIKYRNTNLKLKNTAPLCQKFVVRMFFPEVKLCVTNTPEWYFPLSEPHSAEHVPAVL